MFSRVLRRRKRDVKYYIRAAKRKTKSLGRTDARLAGISSHARKYSSRDSGRIRADSLPSEKLNRNSKKSDALLRAIPKRGAKVFWINRRTGMTFTRFSSSMSFAKTEVMNSPV